jgi:hypothetical protein
MSLPILWRLTKYLRAIAAVLIAAALVLYAATVLLEKFDLFLRQAQQTYRAVSGALAVLKVPA